MLALATVSWKSRKSSAALATVTSSVAIAGGMTLESSMALEYASYILKLEHNRVDPSSFRTGFRVILAAFVLAFGGRIAVTAQSNPDAAKVKNPIAASPESLAAGQQTYRRRCASCHGIGGEGGPGNDLIPAAPNLVDEAWDHGSSDGEIFDNIKNGIGPDFNMVPWKDTLKDDEIWSVVNYLRSIARKK